MRHPALAPALGALGAAVLGAAAVTAAAATLAAGAAAQDTTVPDATVPDAPSRFDVLSAIEGVWAYDPAEVDLPGDYTCADRPMAFLTVDGGARVASRRPGDEAERYGLILDVRNDFPLGPALSIVWQDAPLDANGDPAASVLVMDSGDSFVWIAGESLKAYQAGSRELERSPRRVRCAT